MRSMNVRMNHTFESEKKKKLKLARFMNGKRLSIYFWRSNSTDVFITIYFYIEKQTN